VLGFVVGLAAEARIAARFGHLVGAGGGTPEGAFRAAEKLLDQGATALISFGFAGGLDPALRAGTVVIPTSVLANGDVYAADPILAAQFGGLTPHRLMAGTAIAADVVRKRRLHAATHAHAIDLESGSVASVARSRGVPFVAVRAISDAADQNLPPAALLALNAQGSVNLIRVGGSLLRHPGQLPALLRLAADAARARRALVSLMHQRTVRVEGSTPLPTGQADNPAGDPDALLSARPKSRQ
jgi:adenosylhomocysteine nucleosidase